MNDKKRKTLILITLILLIVLVGVGMIMLFSQEEKNSDSDKKSNVDDNRCVDGLCLSKVSIEENSGSKVLLLTLKNEGTNNITNTCVNIVSKEVPMEFCVEQLEKDQEVSIVLEKSDLMGDDIKDYKLEKVKDIKVETPAENNQTTVTE